MVSALIFIEGGGDGQLHERSFRKACCEFFRSAGLSGRMPAIVRGGGRSRRTRSSLMLFASRVLASSQSCW